MLSRQSQASHPPLISYIAMEVMTYHTVGAHAAGRLQHQYGIRQFARASSGFGGVPQQSRTLHRGRCRICKAQHSRVSTYAARPCSADQIVPCSTQAAARPSPTVCVADRKVPRLPPSSDSSPCTMLPLGCEQLRSRLRALWAYSALWVFHKPWQKRRVHCHLLRKELRSLSDAETFWARRKSYRKVSLHLPTC